MNDRETIEVHLNVLDEFQPKLLELPIKTADFFPQEMPLRFNSTSSSKPRMLN